MFPSPLLRRAIATSLFFTSAIALAAEPIYFQFRDLLAEPSVRDALDPGVKIYLTGDPRPTIVESAAPDIYSGTGISINPFGGSRRHCIEAFSNAIRSMVTDAVAGGYDSIADLRAMDGDKPGQDAHGFSCTPAYKVTVVALHSTIGATAAMAQRTAEADRNLIKQPYRDPWEDSIYIPVGPIAASPEAKAALGGNVKGYWGIDAPAYQVRGIPENYSGSAPLVQQDRHAACKQAVLNTLKEMAENTVERGYDSMIRIRSYLYEQTTPGMDSIECEIGKKAVYVKLRGTPANQR